MGQLQVRYVLEGLRTEGEKYREASSGARFLGVVLMVEYQVCRFWFVYR